MSSDAPQPQDIRSFNPAQYLQEYFQEVDKELIDLYSFWHRAASILPKDGLVLEIGVGPAIYSSIPLVPRMKEIHLADLLESNLSEIRKWVNAEPGCFQWKEHIAKILEIQGIPSTALELEKREKELRSAITKLVRCDLRKDVPVESDTLYELVTAHYCLETAARDRAGWYSMVEKISRLVCPSGALMLSIAKDLRISRLYETDQIPCQPPRIDVSDVYSALKTNGFEVLCLEYQPSTWAGTPYSGTICALARRQTKQFVSKSIMIASSHGERYLVACESIPENSYLLEITGEIVSEKSRYSLQIDEDQHLWIENFSEDDFLDHACDPNCRIEFYGKMLFLRSVRPIDVGEKITFNYLTTEWELANPFHCYCGSKNCMGDIRGFSHLSLTQKRGLAPLLSPFLLRKLREAEESDLSHKPQ